VTDEPKKKRRGRKLLLLATIAAALAGYRARKLSENDGAYPRR
jgi:hypothetical protein